MLWCFGVINQYDTDSLALWEPELGVKDIFDGITTFPFLPASEMLIESCLPNASVNT